MKPTDVIKPGEWRERRVGASCRCMAVVENWVVARYPGAIPFLVFWKDWLKYPLTEKTVT